MDGIAKALNREGYEVVNISYPSFRQPLSEIVQGVAEALGDLEEKRTHFVTHSMGGIVVRYLADERPELVSDRVVMIAPPSHGSEIIDWLQDSPLVKVFGPGGAALSTESVKNETPGLSGNFETGIIMGDRVLSKLFSSLLESENDGIVSVKKGALEGMKDFAVVRADHTFIMNEPEVQKLTLGFLREGKFEASSKRPPQK